MAGRIYYLMRSIKCKECGSEMEQDPIHKLCLRCSNPKCDCWYGLHPPSDRQEIPDA